jgi:hypothetical protein
MAGIVPTTFPRVSDARICPMIRSLKWRSVRYKLKRKKKRPKPKSKKKAAAKNLQKSPVY